MKKQHRVLNIVPSSGKEQDWDILQAVKAGYVAAKKILPQGIDLRETWWKINNQGESGSCVGWVTADGLLKWHFVKNKKIRSGEMLSVRFIWMASKEVDEYDERPTSFIDKAGTSLKAALDVARKFGCIKATDLPFETTKFYRGTEQDLYAKASRYKILSYYNLARSNSNKLLNWKKWLAFGGGPIAFSLFPDKAFLKATPANCRLDTYEGFGDTGGHAAVMVGYEPGYFIIRNSWGSRWGKKGFAWLSDDYMLQAVQEAYGIAV
ncbi:C1 family peptidase [Foetidibacter luteolus]|uniref:C1 family peptidase n=1 Tax=Foetidibacter luteolus TaxID=2608880 RepID=UPI00129BC862|nr:C1 family peptidase [Foetidibacter luteolus]